jgi:hypothetical protein
MDFYVPRMNLLDFLFQIYKRDATNLFECCSVLRSKKSERNNSICQICNCDAPLGKNRRAESSRNILSLCGNFIYMAAILTQSAVGDCCNF